MNFYKAYILTDNMTKIGLSLDVEIWFNLETSLIIEKSFENLKNEDGEKYRKYLTKIYPISRANGSIVITESNAVKTFKSLIEERL